VLGLSVNGVNQHWDHSVAYLIRMTTRTIALLSKRQQTGPSVTDANFDRVRLQAV
jgi:hypothetical protein